jgi:quercetin dioxygenase-like cupin family protein
MRVAKTEELEGFAMGPMTLRPFAGEELMAVRVEVPKGAPAHSHPQEQMTPVISGRMRFRVGSEWREVGPMEAVHIPGGVEHETEVLEDSLFFDL